jgi:opacity protein-like surface antigen
MDSATILRSVVIWSSVVSSDNVFPSHPLFCPIGRMRCAVLPVVFALLSAPAHAVDLSLIAGFQISGDFEVEVEEGSEAEPGRINVDDGGAYALALDFPLGGRDNERLGLYLSHQQTGFSGEAELEDSDLSITHLHFTAQTLWPNGRWEPYLLLGVGAAYFAPADSTMNSKVFFSGQIAGGASYGLTDSLRLRAGARWIPTFFSGSSAVLCNGGCTVAVKSSVWSQGTFELGLQFRF